MSVRGNFSIDDSGCYCANTAYMIASTDLYLLGLLNSSLLTYAYKNLFAVFRGGYLRFFTQYMAELPD